MAFNASMNAQLSLLIVLLTASFSRLHFSQILLSSLHTDQPLLCYLFSTQQQKLKAIRNLMRHNERCFTKGRHEVRSSAERGALHMDSEQAAELWQLTTSRLCSQEQAADLEPLRWLSKLFGALIAFWKVVFILEYFVPGVCHIWAWSVCVLDKPLTKRQGRWTLSSAEQRSFGQ